MTLINHNEKFSFLLRLAVGVSQHGNLEERLKMAFDIYGKFIILFTHKN
jgi:hypothetical protein